MKNLRTFSLLCCILLPAWVAAQDSRVLKPEEIDERTLIGLLAPEPSAKPRTRSINVMREESAPLKPAAASLLITFETNSASLTPKGKQSLDVVARALSSDKLSAFRFAVEGHTDPRGGEEYNQRLSQSRAESVVGYLADNRQIERRRLRRSARDRLNCSIRPARNPRRTAA